MPESLGNSPFETRNAGWFGIDGGGISYLSPQT